MSRPGPDRFLACPHCGARARKGTFSSLSFMGSSRWSDGKRCSIPRLGPGIAACHRCERCFRLDDAKHVDPAEFQDPEGAFPSGFRWGYPPHVRELSEVEYLDALARGDFPDSPDVLRRVRFEAWWARNDPARAPGFVGLDAGAWTPRARANVGALSDSLGDAPHELHVRGEVLRELGAFAESRRMLEAALAIADSPDVRRLLELCEQRDSQVRLLHADGYLKP